MARGDRYVGPAELRDREGPVAARARIDSAEDLRRWLSGQDSRDLGHRAERA